MTQETRSIDLLVNQFRQDNQLLQKLQTDPLATLTSTAEDIKAKNPLPTAATDRFAYRVATVVLGTVVIVVTSLVCAKFYQQGDVKIPDMLIALGSTAMGALAGLVAPVVGNRG